MDFGKKLELLGFKQTLATNGFQEEFIFYELFEVRVVYHADGSFWSLNNTGSQINGDKEDFKRIKKIIKLMEIL